MPAHYVTVHPDGTMTREEITAPVTYESLHPAALRPCPYKTGPAHHWVDVGAGRYSCPCGAQWQGSRPSTLQDLLADDASTFPGGHPCRDCDRLYKDHPQTADDRCEGWR